MNDPEDGVPLPALPGFREMALGRMALSRADLIQDLVGRREANGLTQTEVAARMRTSQSAVARIEAGAADVRASTLERYAAAVGASLQWTFSTQREGQAPPAAPRPSSETKGGHT